MHTLMIILYFLAIVLSVYTVRLICVRQTENEFKYFVISSMFVILYCFFSLIDITTHNLPMDIFCLNMEYIAAQFIVLFNFIFFTKYCRITTPKYIYYVIFIFKCILGAIIIFPKNTQLFIYDVRYTSDMTYSTLKCSYGTIWWIYNSLLALIILITNIAIIYRAVNTKKGFRAKYIMLFCASLIPFVLELITALHIRDDYNFLPVGYLVSMIIINFTILRYKISDVIITAWANIVNTLDSPIIILDHKARLLDANRSARVTFKEIKKVYSHRNEKPRSNGFIKSLINEEDSFEFSYNDHFYEKHCTTIKNDENEITGYILIITDTTQKNNYIDEIKKAKDKALEASQAKSRFLANSSHELRTPMNAIIGFSELILTTNKDDKINTYAHNINNAAKALLDIINDILDSSKLEAEKMEIVCSDYNPYELFDDATKLVTLQAKQKGLSLNYNISDNIPKVLYGDRQRIKQVMTNLLSNAVKYTKEGFVTLSCSFDKTGKTPCLIISVEDSGVGIKESEIPHLFEAFRQSNKVNNTAIEGTGLGLSISYQLVSLMGGEMYVKSTYHKGSTFTAVIPQKIPDSKPFLAPDANILIVDDSHVNLMLLSEILKEHGITPDTAFDGLSALTMIAMKEYDLVYLDHMMPGIDGEETLKRLRQTKRTGTTYYQDLPVIMLTANMGVGVKAKFIEEGANDYIPKPFDIYTINDSLIKWLDESKIIYQGTDVSTSLDQSELLPIDADELNLSIINFEDGLTRSGNSHFTYLSLIKSFVSEAKKDFAIVDEYTNALENNIPVSTDNINRVFHTLKNSAYAIGANDLWHLATELNERLNSSLPLSISVIDNVTQLYRKTCEECNIVAKHIEKNTNNNTKTSSATATDLDITLYLNNVIAASKKMDSPAITQYLQILESSVPEDKKEVISQMINLADDFDYDNLIAECKRIVNELHSYIIT